MKQKILLLLGLSAFIYSGAQKLNAYAITGAKKGSNNWSEVRLVDVSTGEEVQSVYQSSQLAEVLNARTGKPIAKKIEQPEKNNDFTVRIFKKDPAGNAVAETRVYRTSVKVDLDKPFATNSAACAYDKKHERLYYAPMGINQLRYIDLKKGNHIYYLEDASFGALANSRDVPNQITRMVFAADGKGYALTNNGKHLFQFTTNKKATVTDLGALIDDAANGVNSVHSAGGYGGDMIADAIGNLFLITANHAVFKIDLSTKVAAYQGRIQGLPRGYSTNGAMVEEDSKVIVCSSNSTQGYFRFDLNTLQAEKLSNAGPVYNASDLANGNLAFEKKAKDKEAAKDVALIQKVSSENIAGNKISIYPNPVSNGLVKLSFEDQPKGRYQAQFMDVSGKIISERQFNINNKMQVEEYKLPQLIASGNYLMRVVNETNSVISVNKLVVQ